MPELYSLKIEKHCIAGLLRHPDAYADVAHWISPEDFFCGNNPLHRTIFSVIRKRITSNEPIDVTLISQDITNAGISFEDDINIAHYLEELSLLQPTKKATLASFKELKKHTVARTIAETGEELARLMAKSLDKPIQEIISLADKTYNRPIRTFESEDAPHNLSEGLVELIEERGNNPVEDTGLITPFSEFNRFFGGLRDGNVYAIVSRPGQGKALEENTLIPTPKGYTKIKDLQIGDEVFAVDGSITTISNKRSWKNRQTYKIITDDGCEVIADEKHEWVVQRRNDYNWSVCETDFLFNSSFNKKPKLPRHKALILPTKKLLIDPYILGVWLGDGNSDGATITSADSFIIKKWAFFGKRLGLSYKKDKKNKYRHHLYSDGKKNIFTVLLRRLSLLNNKHVPSEYLRSSILQRRALLQGLIDSDGFVNTDGQVEFSNKNKVLAENVLELVHSLGIKASINKTKSFLYKKFCGYRYRVTFYYKYAASLPRKAKRTRNGTRTPYRYLTIKKGKIGNTVCIEIEHPSHLFLCGKGMLPTHNSTWIMDTTAGVVSRYKGDVRALILDTEMETVDIKFRIASAVTGIPMWYLETGNYRKNKEMYDKFQAHRDELRKLMPDHKHVAGKSIDEILSIIRRWYYSCVGRGKKAIIAYDYLKLTGEKITKEWSEYQVMGEKIDKLKMLTTELHCPLITACQLNRSAEGGTDDSSAIAISDRLQWFGTFVAIFRRKTLEEIALDGEEFGTHKMLPLKSRFQGREAQGHTDLVQVPYVMKGGAIGKKYERNYLNYDVRNFSITERGSLKSMAEKRNKQYLTKKPVTDGEIE